MVLNFGVNMKLMFLPVKVCVILMAIFGFYNSHKTIGYQDGYGNVIRIDKD